MVAREPKALVVAAAEVVAAYGHPAIPIATDMRDDEAVVRMVEKAVLETGGVDILVNAAARPGGIRKQPLPLADSSDELLREEFETKVLGYLRCARAVAPHMAAAGWGRIINVGGVAARQTGSTPGSIRNVAVAAMTKNLADELDPLGINVTVVHPGVTETERTAFLLRAEAENQDVSDGELRSDLEARTSIGRLVRADEVASVVAFRASPRSVAIAGDPVVASGGARGCIYY